mgnify:CR=1 FL=1
MAPTTQATSTHQNCQTFIPANHHFVSLSKYIKKHNENKGAKSTKGYNWKLIYRRKFLSKKEAMSYEYKLKKDVKKRKKILKKTT